MHIDENTLEAARRDKQEKAELLYRGTKLLRKVIRLYSTENFHLLAYAAIKMNNKEAEETFREGAITLSMLLAFHNAKGTMLKRSTLFLRGLEEKDIPVHISSGLLKPNMQRIQDKTFKAICKRHGLKLKSQLELTF